MQADVARDLSRSAKAFIDIVFPAVAPALGNGHLIPVESATDSRLAHQLDALAGIDAWHINTDEGIRGIASRVQVGPKDWRSFTIRYSRRSGAETEYGKRLRAIHGQPAQWIFPYLTVQAYLADWTGPLLSAAVARTSDIIKCIENGWCSEQPNKDGNSIFKIIFWADMTKHGFRLFSANDGWLKHTAVKSVKP